uniref:Uncharacterized protein n=1 Tax=Arion vulgaris TaxID=1028688 RepID=A0A0B6Y8H0_9EUPU
MGMLRDVSLVEMDDKHVTVSTTLLGMIVRSVNHSSMTDPGKEQTQWRLTNVLLATATCTLDNAGLTWNSSSYPVSRVEAYASSVGTTRPVGIATIVQKASTEIRVKPSLTGRPVKLVVAIL